MEYNENMGYSFENKKLIENMERLIKENQTNPYRLAKSANLGDSAVRDILSGKSKGPKIDTLQKIATVLNCTVDDFYRDNQPEKNDFKPQHYGLSDDNFTTGYFAKKIPLFGFASATNERQAFNPATDVPIEMIDDTLRLGHILGGYALMIMGDSMEPRYFHGEIVFINPRKPPALNEDCIVMLADGIAHIKRLMRTTRTDYIFYQYNPAREINIKRADVKGLYSIIGRK